MKAVVVSREEAKKNYIQGLTAGAPKHEERFRAFVREGLTKKGENAVEKYVSGVREGVTERAKARDKATANWRRNIAAHLGVPPEKVRGDVTSKYSSKYETGQARYAEYASRTDGKVWLSGLQREADKVVEGYKKAVTPQTIPTLAEKYDKGKELALLMP